MKICLFYHSVLSDWNHGNAHFLRGIMSSLRAKGHDVTVFEPEESWSLRNMIIDKGRKALDDFIHLFPFHSPVMYDAASFNPADFIADADLVIVHEWNDPQLVKIIGDYRAVNGKFILLFHDTHHRSVTEPIEMGRYDLSSYDGVLAFGEVIRKIYLRNSWAKRAWTWHEAADDRIFHPVEDEKEGDLVWIGNWGDDERTEELQEFIIEPVMELGLKAAFYGVRYPDEALKMLKKAKIKYKGYLPNYHVPGVFGRYRVTVHVPRRPYVLKLPGIPTIRPFEAMACGIPLVCSPWNDSEHLFTPGKDYLVATDGEEMKKQLSFILNNRNAAEDMSRHALQTIRKRHTCDNRADELMEIVSEVRNRAEFVTNDKITIEN